MTTITLSNMITKVSLLSFVLIFATLNATVTLQIRTQLANSDGVATNGMNWGVLVDSTGDGFAVTSTGSINAFDFASNGSYGNDDYFIGSSTTVTVPGGDFAGTGVATNTNQITLSGNVSAGDSFGIFWTDKSGGSGVNGDSYGFVTATNAVLPSDGNTTPFNNVFTTDPYTAEGSIVPEPSTLGLLSGVFALCAVTFRRRAG